MYRVRGKWLANVGRMYRVREKALANVGRMYRVRGKGLANVGRMYPVRPKWRKLPFWRVLEFAKLANFRRVLEFDKFAGEWPLLRLYVLSKLWKHPNIIFVFTFWNVIFNFCLFLFLFSVWHLQLLSFSVSIFCLSSSTFVYFCFYFLSDSSAKYVFSLFCLNESWKIVLTLHECLSFRDRCFVGLYDQWDTYKEVKNVIFIRVFFTEKNRICFLSFTK